MSFGVNSFQGFTMQFTVPSFGIDKVAYIGDFSLTLEVILKTLQNVNTSKGPDNISLLVLKNCSENLVNPL